MPQVPTGIEDAGKSSGTCIPVPSRFEYHFWSRHIALRGGLAFLAMTTALGLWAESYPSKEPDLYLLKIWFFVVPGVLVLILTLLGDRVNARRLRPLLLSDDGIGQEVAPGRNLWIDWNDVDRIDRIIPGTLDYVGGGYRSGICVRAGVRSIPIFEHLPFYGDLVERIRRQVESRGLHLTV
jgi:hypothetical protein